MALKSTDLLAVYRASTTTSHKLSLGDLSLFVANESDSLEKPGRAGTFVIVEDASGNVTYETDTSLQPGDDISELVNDVGYLVSGDNVSLLTNDANYIPVGADNTELVNAAGFITAADIPTLDYVPLGSWAAIPAV